MTMTDEEICRDYRAAAAPLKQIGILADLNQCSKERIKQILIKGGCELPGNMRPKPKKEKKDEPDLETIMRKGPPLLFPTVPRPRSVTLVAFDLICELDNDGILDRSLPGIVALVKALREEGYE